MSDALPTEVVDRLLTLGTAPSDVSAALGIPIGFVLHRQSTRKTLVPEDQELAEEIRKLSKRAIREAHVILETGTAEMRMSIIKTMLSGSVRLLGQTQDTTDEEIRAEVASIFNEMRVEASAPAISLAAATHDNRQGPEYDQVSD